MTTAIEGLLAADVDDLDGERLDECVVGLRRLTSRLAAAEARFVQRWDAETRWATDGSRSAAARLARDAHCSPTAAAAVVKRARRLRTMPLTATAFAAGEISVDHVQLLANVNRPPHEQRFCEGEAHLVKVAQLRWFDTFTKALKYWRDCADDDAAEDDAQARYDQRYLKARCTLDDMVDLQGRLDAVGGAIVTEELGRIERDMFEADWATAKQIHGLDTRADHLARTAEQRRADALVEMARRSAAKPADATSARTLLTVLVGYETFAGRVCEMANGTIITPGQVSNLFTNAHGTDRTIDVERVVFDGPSRVIDVGRRTRLFTGGLRRAVEVRDRHCSFPGCTVPAEQCQVDHITEWANGGQTTQDNARLLCPAHNRQRPGRRSPPTTGP